MPAPVPSSPQSRSRRRLNVSSARWPRTPHRPGARRRGFPLLPLPVAPSPANLRARHDRRGSRRHERTRGLLGQTFARRDGNRLRPGRRSEGRVGWPSSGWPTKPPSTRSKRVTRRSSPSGASATRFFQCYSRNFSRNLCARGNCDRQGAISNGFRHQITLRPIGRANGENMGGARGFCRNSMANTAKPATLGQGFCVRRTGLPAPWVAAFRWDR